MTLYVALELSTVPGAVAPRRALGETMAEIFLSYRRRDSSYASLLIAERLREVFGRDRVFLDVDTIGPGARWQHEIDRWVNQCSVGLVVIGDRWLQVASDRSSLDDATREKDDYVQFEVETLLRRKAAITIIPVLLANAQMPPRDQLPGWLEELMEFQAVQIFAGDQFEHGMSKLIERIKERIEPLETPAGPPPTRGGGAARIGQEVLVVPPHASVPMRVWRLPDANQAYDMPIDVFQAGLDILGEQMDATATCGRWIPDLIVGMNNAGLIVGAYLDGSKFPGSRHVLGSVKTEKDPGSNERVLYPHLPDVETVRMYVGRRSPRVLLVDSQLKSGFSSQQVIQELKAKYQELRPDIYYAVLVACGIDLPSQPQRYEMHQLFTRKLNQKIEANMEQLPNYLAYISNETVRAPNGIP